MEFSENCQQVSSNSLEMGLLESSKPNFLPFIGC